MKEIWKDIKDYEGLYQVSNLGKIKSLITNKELKQFKRSKLYPYYCVNLCKRKKHKMYAVHRLVAQTFIPNIKNKPQINHKSGIKTDNRVCNLEWCTNKENAKHAFKKGLSKPKIGKDNNYTKPVNQYDLSGNFIKTWYGGYNIEKEFGKYASSNIFQCAKGNRLSAYGYIWKYFVD